MQLDKTRNEQLILFAGLLVLVAGILSVFYSGRTKTDKPVNDSSVAKLLAQLDTAQAGFEIGYAMMSLDFYKQNEQRYKNGDSGLLTYPIYQNEVASRIEKDSPLVVPDYNRIAIANNQYKTFSGLYKKKKLTHEGTSVICLIIKQKGKGDADSVTLDVDHVKIKDVEELYDALDLGGNNFRDLGIRESNPVQQHKFYWRNMKSGSSALVPLCITNMYFCPSCEAGDNAWQMASYSAYVPVLFTYKNRSGNKVSIPLSNVLGKPIYMEK